MDEDLVKLRVESRLAGDRLVVETPWAQALGGDRYRLDNTPWWRGDLSWRDVVRAEPLAPGDFPTVVALEEPGGHRTFRLLFDARVAAAAQSEVLAELVAAGASYEGTGADREGVYAVDVAPEKSLDEVEAVLRRAAGDGILEFELGGSEELLTRLDEAVINENWTARHDEPDDDAEVVLVECAGHPIVDGVRYEQLWTRRLDGERHELLSAPFFAYDLHAGDVVRVERRARRIPRVAEVVERSRRWVLRVMAEADGPGPDAVADALRERGADVEVSPRWPMYLAVVAADDAHARALRAWLDEQEAAGALVYETAWK